MKAEVSIRALKKKQLAKTSRDERRKKSYSKSRHNQIISLMASNFLREEEELKKVMAYHVEQRNFSFGSATTGQGSQNQNGSRQAQKYKWQRRGNRGGRCIHVFVKLKHHPHSNYQHDKTTRLKLKRNWGNFEVVVLHSRSILV